MFAFRLWSRFGAFRDPITITQNVTLSIPPKTTIGGMLAAILGLDYNEYFENLNYFDFQYSLVLKNPIRKRSFSQNYIEDYTSKSHLKHQSMLKAVKSSMASDEFILKMTQKMPKPKPIRRELLINPNYLIFVKNYIYEDVIVKRLKTHYTGFAFYMGNSEFSANFEFVECSNFESKQITHVDSFTQFPNDIKFEAGKKYTSIYAATKTIKDRKYRDYKKVTISDSGISFTKPVNGYSIKTSKGEYHCEFI